MPVRFYCPCRNGKLYDKEDKWYKYETERQQKYNMTEEHAKKHRDYERDYKEHAYGQGEMDRPYRREFANGKYKWVKTDYFQCRICGIIIHEGDC